MTVQDPGVDIQRYPTRCRQVSERGPLPVLRVYRGAGSGAGFKVYTTAAKPRSFDTILDGWMNGYELKVQSLTNAYEHYMRELATIMANKAFVQRGVVTVE